MNNLVVQLLLKTGTFGNDLKTARGQVQNFQKGCQSAGKSVSAFSNALGLNIGSLTKFGGVVGTAVLAGKEFKAILDSSQTTSDAFQGSIAGCKGVLDSFNTAIATADFSAFKNGLWDVYDAAKAVQEALDQLGNTQIAYDYKTKQNMTKFQEAYNMFKDPEATEQMKADAKAQMKEAVDAQFLYARNYSSSLYKAYVAQVVKKAGSANLRANNVTMAQFEKAMNIDIGLVGDPEKARAENDRQYKEYLAKLKEYGKNNITAQEELKKRYRDVIAIRAMLELMKDDELKGVAQLIGGMEDAKQVALSMEKTYNRAVSASSKTTTRQNVKTQKDELEIQKESLTYWQNIYNEETKLRDALVKGTDEWDVHNKKVEEAKKKIDEINGVQVKSVELVEMSEKWMRKRIADEEELLSNLVMGTDEYNKQKDYVEYLKKTLEQFEDEYALNNALKIEPPTIESLETILSYMQKLQRTIPVDSELFKEIGDNIIELQTKLNTIRGIKAEAPKTDTWDTFNQSMSNTATIVSSLANTFKDSSEVTASSILQMVATCIPAIGSLISSISALTAVEAVEAGVGAVGKAVSSSKHWIEAIAAVASLGAVVAAAIGSAKSQAQKFANGGIVGGNSFTGDRVSANVNSGEMILNRSQQTRLFRMANGSGNGGGQVEFHISGTDLIGVLNNQNRKNRIIG